MGRPQYVHAAYVPCLILSKASSMARSKWELL